MAEADCTVKVDCRICGDAFEYQRLPGPGRLRRFCSPECKVEAASSAGRAVACATCGNEFNRRHAGQIVCGLSCRRRDPFVGPRNRKVSRPPLREVACCGCGMNVVRRARVPGQADRGRYCSWPCYQSTRARVAYEVDALRRIARNWKSRRTRAPGNVAVIAEVAALRRIARYVERPARYSIACRSCGTGMVVLRRKGLHRIVCDPCKAETNKRLSRIAKAKRRAVERGSDAENIDPIAVFARDGWACRLCGVKTPKHLRGSYSPQAPELDHVVPLAAGGRHTWGNVQCACRRCNGLKGASVLPMAA